MGGLKRPADFISALANARGGLSRVTLVWQVIAIRVSGTENQNIHLVQTHGMQIVAWPVRFKGRKEKHHGMDTDRVQTDDK